MLKDIIPRLREKYHMHDAEWWGQQYPQPSPLVPAAGTAHELAELHRQIFLQYSGLTRQMILAIATWMPGLIKAQNWVREYDANIQSRNFRKIQTRFLKHLKEAMEQDIDTLPKLSYSLQLAVRELGQYSGLVQQEITRLHKDRPHLIEEMKFRRAAFLVQKARGDLISLNRQVRGLSRLIGQRQQEVMMGIMNAGSMERKDFFDLLASNKLMPHTPEKETKTPMDLMGTFSPEEQDKLKEWYNNRGKA